MKTYLKVAVRCLHREKLYAAINIAGLALAFASCIVLALYLRGELTYDQHHVDHERIYRLVNVYQIGENPQNLAVTAPVIAPMMAEAYPEIEAYVRFLRARGQSNMLITHETDAFYWDHVYFADRNVFEVFTHESVYGEMATALDDPTSMAVSRSFARRYFGDANPVGETLRLDNGQERRITLVFEDLPANTHLKYDVLLPLVQNAFNPSAQTMRLQLLWNLGNFIYSYFVMPEGYDVDDFQAIAQDFYDENMAPVAEVIRSSGAGEVSWQGWLQPLADIHLDSDLVYDRPTGNRYYLYGFATVAVFIMLVACINYVNLSTARATRRAQAVGLRKILGASRWSLIAQFLGESVLFALLAALLGAVIVEVALTFTPIETLLGVPLTLDFTGEPALAGYLVGIAVVVGLLAGLYPAVYLSSWAPLTALVSTSKSGRGGFRFRQALVFAQFAISIAVIASALLMAAQMRYIQNRSLGFAPENRVMITLRGTDVIRAAPTIMTELTAHPNVLGAATTSIIMGQDLPAGSPMAEDATGAMQRFNSGIMFVGDGFTDVMGLELIEGRDFSQRLLTDVGSSLLVNETFVRGMGWETPIGKRIDVGEMGAGRVIGVVEDFNFKSLHHAIEPIAILLQPELGEDANSQAASRILVVNIAGEQIGETLRMLEDTFAEFDPEHPFEFRFVDDFLDQLYQSEQSLMRLVGVFAGICIVIACLGLYGLAAFTAEQRTREIGIRKILGATGLQIVLLLSRNILLLILLGAAVASLGAYVAIDLWLQNFAYRATINPLVFGAATLLALAVAFATVALQASATIRSDPVDALRYE